MEIYAGEIDITKLKKGDVFYEIAYGVGRKMTVLYPPARNDEGEWLWYALDSDGNKVQYFINQKYAHYGPKLYSELTYEGITLI